jgi:hypothetical protein
MIFRSCYWLRARRSISNTNRLTFVLPVECCRASKCSSGSNILLLTHSLIKCLIFLQVWTKFDCYTSDNTLLLDDSVLKTHRNPVHTAVHPPEWSAAQTDDKELLVSCGDGLAGFLLRVVERTPGTTVPMVVAADPYAVSVNGLANESQ